MAQRSDGLATRERLLAASAMLIATEGPSALTLDRAAEAGGVSKGAILYHFRSKDALVSALVQALLDHFDAATEKLASSDAVSKGSYARAYAKVSFDPRNKSPEAAAGLLVAVANDIALLKPAAERHAEYQQRLEDDGISPTIATLVRLASDGLYFARAFGLAPPSDAQSAKVLKLMLELIDTELLRSKGNKN
jgi:AcrR family transcriptional regulator